MGIAKSQFNVNAMLKSLGYIYNEALPPPDGATKLILGQQGFTNSFFLLIKAKLNILFIYFPRCLPPDCDLRVSQSNRSCDSARTCHQTHHSWQTTLRHSCPFLWSPDENKKSNKNSMVPQLSSWLELCRMCTQFLQWASSSIFAFFYFRLVFAWQWSPLLAERLLSGHYAGIDC